MNQLSNQELGERLRGARTAAGLTQEEAALALEVSRPTFIAIEKGSRIPSAKELVRLAEIYSIQVNQLLSLGAVSVDFVARFRSMQPEQEPDEAHMNAVFLLSRLAASTVEIERALGVTRPSSSVPELKLHSKNLEQQAEDAATSLRHRLGIGLAPIEDIVTLMETELGVLVFVRPLAPNISGVFGFDEKIGGCVLLNSLHPRERRFLSAAHELGHFVAYRAFVDVADDAIQETRLEEKFCRAFSYAFVMPASAVRRKFLDMSSNGKEFTPRDLILLAHLFHVSHEAMCRRLEELDLLKKGMWERLRRRGFGGPMVRALTVLGDRPDDQRLVLPPRLAALIAEAYEKELFSEGQLCNKLGLDRVELRQLLEAFSVDADTS